MAKNNPLFRRCAATWLALVLVTAALADFALAQKTQKVKTGTNVAAALQTLQLRDEHGREFDLRQRLARAPLNLLVLYRGVW